MADTSAFDQPEARGLRIIVTTLRVVVAAQCFGAAILRFVQPGTSALVQMLSESGHLPVEHLVTTDRVIGGLLVCSGMFSLTRPCWPVLGPVMLYFLSDAFAVLGQGEQWQLYLRPVEQIAMVAAPCALMLLDLYPPKSKFSLFRFMTSGSIVRLAAALTFLGHGVMSISQALGGGEYVTILQNAAGFLANRSFPDDVVSFVLAVIGAADIAVAINLMATRSRLIAAGMAAWGFVTAGAWIFNYSPVEGIGQMLVRFANGGLPTVVFLYWTLAVQEREHVIVAKKKPAKAKVGSGSRLPH